MVPAQDRHSGPVLFCCALKAEAELLMREPDLAAVGVTAIGLGPERCRRNLDRILSVNPPRFVVFTGTAGGLDPSLAVGDIVFPEKWSFNGEAFFRTDQTLTTHLRARGWDVEGIGWTTAVPVTGLEERRALFERSRARVCDMEAAAVFEVARRHRVPAIAFKIVSDSATAASPPLTLKAFRENLPNLLPKLARRLADVLSDLNQVAS